MRLKLQRDAKSKSRRSTLPALVFALLVACLPFAVAARARNAGPRAAQPKTPRARKIDAFGRLHGCDGGARLDNFAIELMNQPDSTAYILAYDALNHAPWTAHFWGKLLLNYLVNARGLEQSRIQLVDAGRHAGDDVKIELWLVPPGAEPPAPSPVKEKKGVRQFSGKFDELFAFDDTQFYDMDGDESGSYSVGVTYAAFDEVLKRQPNSQGYLVVYSKPGGAPGYWYRIGTREQRMLARDGIDAQRLTIIRGGVNEGNVKGIQGDDKDEEEQYGRVELWVGEKDKPPVKHVPEKKTLAEALMVGSVNDFFEEERINAWALNNLFEMLRASGQSTACLIVYPNTDTEPLTGSDGKEIPRTDLFKLAESMKAELHKRGVEETRIVLMNGPSREGDGGKLELWAVPYGASLPDPFAVVEEEAEPEEANPKE